MGFFSNPIKAIKGFFNNPIKVITNDIKRVFNPKKNSRGGFFSNPVKATKGFISNVIPGGKYLTGRAVEHQKFHYNAALDRYNAHANTARNQINALSQKLQQSIQHLKSLEERKYIHNVAGDQLGSRISGYEERLANLEQEKSAANFEAQNLEKAVSAFKAKVPLLAGKISDLEKLPSSFQDLYSRVMKQKEQLAGLSHEEAGGFINKHKEDVEDLKKQRKSTEEKIRATIAEISAGHSDLGLEKANLERSLERYKYRQDRLLQEGSSFQQQRNNLQKLLQDYKNEQDRINNDYDAQEKKVKAEEVSLQNYINSNQEQLDSLGREVSWRAGKYNRESKVTGLVQGGALALGALRLASGLKGLAGNITTKAGLAGTATSTPLISRILGGLGTGLNYVAPLVGIGHYLNQANKGQKLKGFERIELGNERFGEDLSKLTRYGLEKPKVAIPELGGLKQSLEHFNMPIVPKLKDLPHLHESLGKIVSLGDIKALSLGLPQMTSASGRQYSSEVLYDPDFIKKLRKVSRSLGMPYLKPNRNMRAGIAYA